MSHIESSLRNRVIFVVGAPRSGTTLLAALLCAHSEIAGTTAESWMFERGVGELFFDYETENRLGAFVSRPQLVELIREMTDGVLGRMRDRMQPGARYVLEKTPTIADRPEIPLMRKLECYPDAWYVHVVRDRDATVDSLMKASFSGNPSRRASEQWIDDGVRGVRHVFGAAENYREVSYEDLASEPQVVLAALYSWLGLECDEDVLGRVEMLSKERYAPHRPRYGADGDERPTDTPIPGPSRRPWRRRHGRTAADQGSPDAAFGDAFGKAFKERDEAALEKLTAPAVEVTVRTADGDLEVTAADGRRALLDAGRATFASAFVSESWAVLTGESVSVLFSGIRPDGTRVDLCCMAVVRGGVATRVAVLSVGSLAGRTLREWSPGLP